MGARGNSMTIPRAQRIWIDLIVGWMHVCDSGLVFDSAKPERAGRSMGGPIFSPCLAVQSRPSASQNQNENQQATQLFPMIFFPFPCKGARRKNTHTNTYTHKEEGRHVRRAAAFRWVRAHVCLPPKHALKRHAQKYEISSWPEFKETHGKDHHPTYRNI